MTCMRRPCGVLTGWGSFPITKHDAMQINGLGVDTSDPGMCPWDDSFFRLCPEGSTKVFLAKCASKAIRSVDSMQNKS